MKTRLTACVVLLVTLVAYGQEPKDSLPGKKSKGRGPGSQSAFGAPPWRQQWEYSMLEANAIRNAADGDLQAGLNKLGNEGWELLAVHPLQSKGRARDTYYFKRATSPALTGVVPGPFGRGGRAASGSIGSFAGPTAIGGFSKSIERGPDGPPPSTPPGVLQSDGRKYQIIPLKEAPASAVAAVLKETFSSARVYPFQPANSLVVVAAEPQMREISELAAKLDVLTGEKRK